MLVEKRLFSPNKLGQLIPIAFSVTSEQVQQQCTTGTSTIVKPHSSALYRCTIVSAGLAASFGYHRIQSVINVPSIQPYTGCAELTIVSFDIVFENLK